MRRFRVVPTLWSPWSGATWKILGVAQRHCSEAPLRSQGRSGLPLRKRLDRIFEGEARICRWETRSRRLVQSLMRRFFR